LLRNLRELYSYRLLLWSLTQRELQARYRSSVLGFLWTFLNPTLHMLVYAMVFKVYMKSAIPNYAYFMFVGLLPWIWFSTSAVAGATSISDRRDLLTKVRFPAQVLPATVVTTNLINYLLALPLMLTLGAIFGVWPTWHALLFPVVAGVQLIFTLAITYLLSALNVTFRDLQYIVSNVVMLGFFLTPVLYPASLIPEEFRAWVLILNPMASLTGAYQAIFFEHQNPDLVGLSVVLALSLGLLWIAASIFERRREEFAEAI